MTCASGCSTLGEIVNRISVLLQDADPDGPNTRWSQASIIDYINEALCRVSARRPDAFAKTAEITLKPGALQSLPPAYQSLNSVETSVAPDGSETPVQQVDDRFSKIFAKKKCLSRDRRCENPRTAAADPCAAYVVKSFVKNPIDEKSFRVEPPVPVGCSPRVVVTVVRKPTQYCASDVDRCLDADCEYEALIVEWALYRAMSIDTESAALARAAAGHLAAFEQMLAGDYLAEQRYGSGYYRGMEGTGDPVFRQR